MMLTKGICKVCRSSFRCVGVDAPFGDWTEADDILWRTEGKVGCPIEGNVRDVHGSPVPDCTFREEQERAANARCRPERSMAICERCESFTSTYEVENIADGTRRVVHGVCMEHSLLEREQGGVHVPDSCPFILEQRMASE